VSSTSHAQWTGRAKHSIDVDGGSGKVKAQSTQAEPNWSQNPASPCSLTVLDPSPTAETGLLPTVLLEHVGWEGARTLYMSLTRSVVGKSCKVCTAPLLLHSFSALQHQG
jgi:hypothetical protein